MTASQNQPPSRSGSPFWRGVGRVLKVLLRLLVVLVFGVLIGAGFYYGIPWVYRTLVQPVQENRVRIVALEQSLEQERTRVQDEAAALRERATDLEKAVTELRETSGVQAQRLHDLETRTAEIQTQIDGLVERVTDQEAAMSTLETELGEEMTALEQALASELESEVEAALKEIDARYAEIQAQANVLEGRLALIQTAQDLLKVRLLLLEENPRAARDTVALAVDHLTRARVLTPSKSAALLNLQERIEGLDELIAQDSYRVAPELEALWADVMDMVLPSASELPPPVPTRTPWITPTLASPVPTPTLTSTPEP